MEVTLLHSSPLELADLAIGKCWDKESKDEEHKLERIHRVGNKNKHASTLEHINYTFDIDGISRGLLQELSRHRMQSLSVKSTRYTLKELQKYQLALPSTLIDKFLVPVSDRIDGHNYNQLINIIDELNEGVANDKVKYLLPEAYKTSLVSTMNMRALQNFLALRTNKAALWEIQELARAMFEVIPNDHRYMLKEFICQN
jgi:thymidylate synthase (FAD)